MIQIVSSITLCVVAEFSSKNMSFRCYFFFLIFSLCLLEIFITGISSTGKIVVCISTNFIVVWRWFFFTLISHTSMSVSRFRFIDLDPAAVVLVAVALFFYIKETLLQKDKDVCVWSKLFVRLPIIMICFVDKYEREQSCNMFCLSTMFKSHCKCLAALLVILAKCLDVLRLFLVK